jgi:SAM-dependent methyltransferase
MPPQEESKSMTAVSQKAASLPDRRDCPVCASGKTGFFVEKNGHAFLKCQDCDLVYVHPALPPQELAPLYAAQGAPATGLRYPFDKIDSRRARAKVRAARLQKYFVNADAIDLGCGGGYMVEGMKKAGAKRAVGIDLDPEAIEFAKKNHHPEAEYYCEAIEQFLKRGEKFDFGHSSQVIEHVGNFNEFVAGWAALVRPGGRFFLKTPDRKHWLTGRDPGTWPNPPSYTQYFSRRNIRLLLEKHGFEVEKIFFNLKPAMEIIARRK